MFDVTALGELLIDFVQDPKAENMQFLANAGGAPANVLACLSRLGKKTAFIGKVGDDMFGSYLSDTLNRIGINTDGLVMSGDEFTTLAFVALDDNGNRTFSFARKNSADVMLGASEVKLELIGKSRIFHCGTLSLTHPCSGEAALVALKFAKEKEVCISVDPNLRLNLWESEAAAKEAIKLCLEYADIIKISDYEVNFLYGDSGVKTAAEKIAAEKALSWALAPTGNGLRVSNASARYITIDSITLNGQKHAAGMVAPFSSLEIAPKGVALRTLPAKFSFTTINDYGAVVNHNYPQ